MESHGINSKIGSENIQEDDLISYERTLKEIEDFDIKQNLTLLTNDAIKNIIEENNIDFLNDIQNTFRSSSIDEKESNERQNQLISKLVSENKIKQTHEKNKSKKSLEKIGKTEINEKNKNIQKDIYDKSFTKRPVEDELYIEDRKSVV